MKSTLLACILALAATFPVLAEGDVWKTDFEAAKAEAKKESKLLFLDFTGSDWCPPCKMMKSETLDKAAFLDFAKKQFVLVEVDFPRRKTIPSEQKRANNALQKEHAIEGYPTFLILDAEGKELGRHVGYLPGGPEAFIAKIKSILQRSGKLPA